MGDFETGECRHIRRLKTQWGQPSWGFVIYRCTSYSSDDNAEWGRFMDILNQWTRQRLEEEDAGDLMESLDWVVQEDRDTLEGKGKEEVRSLFRHYLSSLPKARWNTPAVPRYRYCIMVDDACLNSVLKGPQPDSKYGDPDGKGYVYLIDSQWKPETDDEGYRPIEGCTQEDVGWTKLRLASVAPRSYNVLEGNSWSVVYVRPPSVAIP